MGKKCKILVLICLLFSGTVLRAQYVDSLAVREYVTLTMKGSKVYADYVRISRKEAAKYFVDCQGTDQSARWHRYRKGHNIGTGLQVGGIALGTVSSVGFAVGVVGTMSYGMTGILSCDLSDAKKFYRLTEVSAYTFLGSGVMFLSGAAVKLFNRWGMKKMVNGYTNENKKPDLTVKVGGQADGLGLAIVF